jgi:translation initiation factor 1
VPLRRTDRGGDAASRRRRRPRAARGAERQTGHRRLGLPLRADELQALASTLKQSCGTGGTAKDGVIEIQGDHRERIVAALRKAGHEVKLAGG